MSLHISLPSAPSTPLVTSKNLQLLAAAVLGIIILLGVGFAPMDVAHNAAHDTRHSVSPKSCKQ